MKAGRPWWIILAATVCLAAACGDAASRPTRADATQVPNSHPAVDLAARSSNSDEFAAEARTRDLAFACGKGGPGPQWDVCVVRSAGVVAVVGFGDTTPIDVRLTGPLHDSVPVPLESDIVYGVAEPSGTVRLVIESDGQEIGDLEAEL